MKYVLIVHLFGIVYFNIFYINLIEVREASLRTELKSIKFWDGGSSHMLTWPLVRVGREGWSERFPFYLA